MKLAVIGVGLIGGSVALKLRAAGAVDQVFGVDASTEHLEAAVEKGIIDKYGSLQQALKEADLILLAIPVDATTKLLPQVLDLVQKRQTVMDVGSTKAGIVASVKNHPNRAQYVAFHPMWGTENSGPGSATADSFAGRSAVICDATDSSAHALKTAEFVAEALGMSILHMDAASHDIHAAYISHISHITSYALANTVLEKEREEERIFQLASSGFSSTVRLAKSHPEMWVPIFRENKENVLDVLNEHISQLRKFKSALEKENWELLEELIRSANRIRGILK